MKLNATTVLKSADHVGPVGRVALVPYLRYHVQQYHKWMQSADLRLATASEPLSLEEEYVMQKTWLEDDDKLTFIIHWSEMPLNLDQTGDAGALAGFGGMVGDVNVFFSDAEVEDGAPGNIGFLRAEVEIMVAEPAARRRGLAELAVKWIMEYVALHVDQICTRPCVGIMFNAIVGHANRASEHMFREKLCFDFVKSIDVFQENHFCLKWCKGEEWPFQIPTVVEERLDV